MAEQHTKETKASRVLIVDDMPINRMILSSLLAANGVESDLAESGAQCLSLCSTHDYDLILLDHRMPEIDGVDTLVQLKEMFRHNGHETPVVCHTTEDARKNINLYKAAGFADVLIKPIDPKQLSDILMTYLPEGRLADEDRESAARQHLDDELSVLPPWLKTVPHLDLISGIEHCDTAEDYVDALSVFSASIAEKSAEIERYAAEGNWAMYTLRVHSLKSVARLIGAVSLAEHAADLEYAGKQEQLEKLRSDTPALLREYRAFDAQLAPLRGAAPAPVPAAPAPAAPARNHLLFIGGDHGIVSKGIVRHLEDAGFQVTCIPDSSDAILDHRFDAELLLYYPVGDKEHIRMISAHLAELCQDDHKTLTLTGDPLDIEEARKIHAKDRISAIYPRPVDLDRFVAEMLDFADMQHEYNRTKSILVIDDDMDFLTIMDQWLRGSYKVDCARSGTDALFYLNRSQPDLILLDYEMPELDGYQVMQQIRHNPQTHRIPIIFLTGRNERENVMKILERKPDGYLLKSMPKEALLDALERFFAESILRDH